MTTRHIAIMRVHGFYEEGYGYSSYDDYNKAQMVQHVTEFEEVSEEDFKMLEAQFRSMSQGTLKYVIVEKVEGMPAFIANTVRDYKKVILKREEEMRKMEEKRAKEAAERKRVAEEKKLAKAAKLLAASQAEIEAMAGELGVTVEQATLIFQKLNTTSKKTKK